MATPVGTRQYSTKIIKAGALLEDTRVLLAHWDPASPVPENLARFRQENLFGKASRSRVEDILAIFRQRYLAVPEVTAALSALAQGGAPADVLDALLLYYAAQADSLLHDVVTEVVWPRYEQGRLAIGVDEIAAAIRGWAAEGKTAGDWSEPTIRRVCQGLLSSLRDWRILQGAVHKQIAPLYLPVGAFAYLALALSRTEPSGDRLRRHPEWRLFLQSPAQVERLFLEAHQAHLLEYQAAGSIIRITFPTASLVEYAHAILSRTA